MDKRRGGSIAESKVSTALIREGAIVSQPLYYEARYDLVADFSGDIYRVQVKRAFDCDKDNSVKVEARSRNSGGNSTYSEDEVDSIAVYIPHNDSVHWYWLDEISDQFNIYIGDWQSLRPANKAQTRNPSEYKLPNRKI